MADAAEMSSSIETAAPLLIINDELPIFPGGGGVEYLTTLHMPTLLGRVGLVSMTHRRRDLERSQGLADAGVTRYLWQSPHLDGVPASSHTPVLRRLHALFARAVAAWKAGSARPVESVMADGAFRNMAAPLKTALAEGPWPLLSVIQSHAARMIDYVPKPFHSVLVMHDVRAVLYERRARIAASRLARWAYRRQAARYHAFEREYCARYDVVVTVSEADAAYVRSHYRPRYVITRPLPIDCSYFGPQHDVEVAPTMIVFTGLMNHPPNADAALYMARDVFPLVREILPEAEFWIIGRHPLPEVAALADLPGVHVTGEVPDVRPFLARAAVVVVPLRYGSGSRQKILEAWAMEKCVVSTSIGAEGLPFEDGVHLAIADDAVSIAQKVVHASMARAWRTSLGRAGRAIVLRDNDPRTVARNYAQALQASMAIKRRQPAPLRVALDLRWLIPGLAGGIEHVARAFLREILALDRHNYYTLILPAQTRDEFDVRGRARVRVVCRDSAAEYLSGLSRGVRRRLSALCRLDFWESQDVVDLRWARSLDAEMVYSFPGYTFPDVHVLPQVLMVPDVQHEYCPQFFSPQALEERTRVYRDSIARALHICAISEFTRQTLLDKLGVNPEKVTAIPLAADPIFTMAADAASDAEVLRRHGLEHGRYLFFPGHTWHHKNHRTAITALRVLRDRYGMRLPLVCTGGAREAQGAIAEAVAGAGVEQEVRFLGYCPRPDLPALYRGAACLVFPSLFEGFGMPVLEAMACGCPVVCSNTTSLPEIAGNAARLVDPLDAEEIARAIADTSRDAELRDCMRRRGIARAAEFSWRRHTLETFAVFQRVRKTLTGAANLE